MTENVGPDSRGLRSLVLGVLEVLELNHPGGVVLLPQQFRAVLPAVGVAHLRDAVRRCQLRGEDVVHAEHFAVELLAGSEVADDEGEVVDAETEGLRVRKNVAADGQEVRAILTGFEVTGVGTLACQCKAAGEEADGNHPDEITRWS